MVWYSHGFVLLLVAVLLGGWRVVAAGRDVHVGAQGPFLKKNPVPLPQFPFPPVFLEFFSCSCYYGSRAGGTQEIPVLMQGSSLL